MSCSLASEAVPVCLPSLGGRREGGRAGCIYQLAGQSWRQSWLRQVQSLYKKEKENFKWSGVCQTPQFNMEKCNVADVSVHGNRRQAASWLRWRLAESSRWRRQDSIRELNRRFCFLMSWCWPMNVNTHFLFNFFSLFVLFLIAELKVA